MFALYIFARDEVVFNGGVRTIFAVIGVCVRMSGLKIRTIFTTTNVKCKMPLSKMHNNLCNEQHLTFIAKIKVESYLLKLLD